jgi:hypothetical protein
MILEHSQVAYQILLVKIVKNYYFLTMSLQICWNSKTLDEGTAISESIFACESMGIGILKAGEKKMVSESWEKNMG